MRSNRVARNSRYALPPIESGYVLDPALGWFSAILPTGSDVTNMVYNPSVETATTGYGLAIAGAIARDATIQKFGSYSLKCTPSASLNDGCYFGGGTIALVAGTQYFASVWFKGQRNLKYKFAFITTAGASLGAETFFLATGFWQRVSVAYLETSTTTRRIYIRKDNQTNVTPFWTDGWQCEADQLTTYLDGDMKGFVRNRLDFYWTGIPHVSTSVRIGQCRAGGIIVPFDKFGFRLLSVIGLGMGGIVNQMTPLARGGAYYGGTVIADRQFTIVGQVDDSSGYLQLGRKRQAMIDLFKPDVVSPTQPVVLRWTPTDDCGNQQGNEQEIVCVYQDGLSGRVDNLNAERIGLQFQLYLPFVMQEVGNVGATLNYSTDITDADNIIARINGDWQALGSGMNGTVNVIKSDPSAGRVYLGGIFTTANGATHNRITYWDVNTGAFVDMLNGFDGAVFDIAIAPNHDVWIVGSFTLVNGVAAKGVARWNYSAGTWTAFNPAGTMTAIRAVLITPEGGGRIWIGGDFLNWDGDAAADYLAMTYDGITWDAPGTSPASLNAIVYDMALMSNNRILLGGNFTAPFTRYCYYWPETGQFGQLGLIAPNGIVRTIAPMGNGEFFVGGSFTSPDAYIFGTDHSGQVYYSLGGNLDAEVYRVQVAPNSDLYVGGYFTEAGGSTLNDGVTIFSGNTWTPLDVNLPGTALVLGIDFMPNSQGGLDVYLGYDTTGTATTAGGTVTVNNPGSAASGPRLTFTGPGRIVSVRNVTTNKNIFFNITLLNDETAVLDLTNPSNITFVSSYRGNVLSYILAGSQVSQFTLAPGDNIISVFIDGTVDAGTSANIEFRVTSHSLDAAIPGRLLP